jgi:TM2 domain-containing membrane protein YozV
MSDNDRDQDLSRYPPPQAPPHNQPQQHGPWQHQSQQVAPKSPPVALIASFFIPGLGSLLNGSVTKGIAFMVTYFVSWFCFWLLAVFLIGFLFLPVCFVVWIWGMVDAYQGAQRWNARHGIIS